MPRFKERRKEGIEVMLKVQSCSSTPLSSIYNVNDILSPKRVLVHDNKAKGINTSTKPKGRTASKEGGSIPQKELHLSNSRRSVGVVRMQRR